MAIKSYYAMGVYGQQNPNAPKREKWINPYNAIGYTSSYTYSHFTKNNKTYNHPYTLSAHDFRIDLDDDVEIKKLTFHIYMKVTGCTVKYPSAVFCMYGKAQSSKYDEKLSNNKSGWYDGYYIKHSDYNASKSWTDVTYTMSEANWEKGGFTIEDLKETVMGVDLKFQNATFTGTKGTGNIYIGWVRLDIEYEKPKYNIVWDKVGTEGVPIDVPTNKQYSLVCTLNQSNTRDAPNKTLELDVPFGSELVAVTPSTGSSYSLGTWTVPNTGESHSLTLDLLSYSTTPSKVSVSDDDLYSSTWIRASDTNENDYENIVVTTDDAIHLRHPVCFTVEIDGISDDGTATYTFNTESLDYINTTVSIMSTGVSKVSSTSSQIVFNVPTDEEYHIVLDYCAYPTSTGDKTLTITSSVGDDATLNYRVTDAYEYVIGFNPVDFKYRTNRLLTGTELGEDVIPMGVKSGDAVMTQSKSSLKMKFWELIDYIGCVPIEHHHFDPKSTYKDKLLNTKYKNKRYMGKELASDEDIDLNIRLHPHQVTTIQGLIDMDKPIPINANHKCFESDALNHRGWAEIYSIKAEETNPHWYKCSIDVKYLSHNLNTRFHIKQGNKVNTLDVPKLMYESVRSGSKISSGNIDDDFFEITTDGTYYYNDDTTTDVDDTMRNLFSIDEEQSIYIRTKKPLANISQISLNWASTLLSEAKENYIVREIRLLKADGDKEPVFIYNYHDFEITDDNVSCSLQGDVLEGTVYDSKINQTDIDMRLFTSDLEEDMSSEVVIEDDDEEEVYYGSTVHFNLENNRLTVIEEGFNGQEFSETVELEDSDYIWEMEWINKNNDGDDNDITCYLDLVVQETLLSTQYGDKYSNLVISPFPVVDKTLLFTREAEEGTIFYYLDDGHEFSYLIEPYYQYHNGTDLTDGESSIFNLNYGYVIVFIQNGLVRLGFNRLNGRLYLAKYDPVAQTYITTQYLQLTKYEDINVNSISDDKIEIQASDSIFTIWRGHPYIMITHPSEDIFFDGNFVKVWGERVGDGSYSEYPTYWDLYNHDNLLSACVGSPSQMKSSCLSKGGEDGSVSVDRTQSTLSWSNAPSTHELGTDLTLKFNTTGSSSDFIITSSNHSGLYDELELNTTYEGSFGVYDSETIIDNTIPYGMTLDATSQTIQSGDNDELYARVYDYENNGISGKTVHFFEEYVPTTMTLSASQTTFQTGDDVDFFCRVKDADGSAIRDKRVEFYQLMGDIVINDPTEHSLSQGGLSTLFTVNRELTEFDLECEFKTSCESRFVIGDANSFEGNPNNTLIVGSFNGSKAYYGYRDTSTHTSDLNNIDVTTYKSMKMEYWTESNGNGACTFTIDGVSYTLTNLSIFNDVNEFVVGLVSWGNGTVYVKNIRLGVYR